MTGYGCSWPVRTASTVRLEYSGDDICVYLPECDWLGLQSVNAGSFGKIKTVFRLSGLNGKFSGRFADSGGHNDSSTDMCSLPGRYTFDTTSCAIWGR